MLEVTIASEAPVTPFRNSLLFIDFLPCIETTWCYQERI
jgi:hypothetical protein